MSPTCSSHEVPAAKDEDSAVGFGNLKTLFHMVLRPIHGDTHAERMESFYAQQAGHYDAFRKRLLHGREDMFNALEVPENGVWADMGGGTGSSLVFMGPKVERLRKGYIVDLCPSLLAQARRRIDAAGCPRIHAVEADVTRFVPEEGTLDVATFSYSLTMIPDWFKAVDHVCGLLKPGGLIGVVDFFVSRKYPPDSHVRHSWFTRSFWPLWFACDNVFLSPEHVPYLESRLQPLYFSTRYARMPYLPGARVPYYVFVGKKRTDSLTSTSLSSS